MEFLKEIKEKTLLLVEDNLKNKILENIEKENQLINIKIMTRSEFIKHYFYDYNEETIYYIAREYHTNSKNAKIYLENMKYVNYLKDDNSKVKFLKELYQDLKEKKLIIVDDFY